MWPLLLDSLRSQAETIGFWAGLLTTIAFAPQLVKAWKTGGEGLSWAMLALFGTGVWMWFVYGLLRMSGPIMAANALTGLQVLAIFVLKVRHAGRAKHRAESTSTEKSSATPSPEKIAVR
jgi:MtN3 and saliva related transmembrane protein